jgi:hypothetical protein
MIAKFARTLANTLIAFETNDSKFHKLSEQLVRFLRSKGINARPTERPFHVSVSYINESFHENVLLDLMEEADGAGKFRGVQFVPLMGKDGYVYLSLQVDPGAQFFSFKRKVDKFTHARRFNAFKAHISLARFHQAYMTDTLISDLQEMFDANFSIKSDRVLLYDQSHSVYRSMEAAMELYERLEAKNRMGKHSMESLMRRILDSRTKGFFKDEYWSPISSFQKDFAKEMIDLTLVKSEYFRSKDSTNEMPDGKEWVWEIPYSEKGGWYLRVVASFGPSPLSNPNSVYDLIYTLTWSAKVKASQPLKSRRDYGTTIISEIEALEKKTSK